MPLYTYKCSDCKLTSEFYLSMAEFTELKNNLKCESCSSEKIARVFAHISSTVEKSAARVIEDIKQDVRHIVKKIKSGDVKTIKTIYGNE